MKARLLDLFCGAGGAAAGYARAGFEVVGVDHVAQPRYPFKFVQADAFEVLVCLLDPDAASEHYEDWLPATKLIWPFDAIHASPPCQAFTDLKGMWNAKTHEDLLTPTRALLEQTGLPYVIENVPGAPMNGAHVTLCGSAFRLGVDDAELRRHRHFETSFPMLVPPCTHGWRNRVIGVYGGHGRDRQRKINTQDYTVAERRLAMGIDWMSGEELSQAIPPVYTEFIGHRLMQHIRAETVTR